MSRNEGGVKVSNKIISTRPRRRAVERYSRVINTVKAYWKAIFAFSGTLLFVALVFAGSAILELDSSMMLVLAPILAWLGLAGMAVVWATAVLKLVAAPDQPWNGPERARWTFWVSTITLLAAVFYSALFSWYWAAVALGLWYVAVFLFFNEEVADRIIVLLS